MMSARRIPRPLPKMQFRSAHLLLLVVLTAMAAFFSGCAHQRT